jgi:hypothetical protein
MFDRTKVARTLPSACCALALAMFSIAPYARTAWAGADQTRGLSTDSAGPLRTAQQQPARPGTTCTINGQGYAGNTVICCEGPMILGSCSGAPMNSPGTVYFCLPDGTWADVGQAPTCADAELMARDWWGRRAR